MTAVKMTTNYFMGFSVILRWYGRLNIALFLRLCEHAEQFQPTKSLRISKKNIFELIFFKIGSGSLIMLNEIRLVTGLLRTSVVSPHHGVGSRDQS